MSDLIRGRYPATHPLSKLFASYNTTQGNVAVRSNVEWFGFSGISDGALAATGVAAAVPVPVEVGDTISAITIFVGGTAEATGTQAWAALYSGLAVPALMAQSTSLTGATAVSPASAAFKFTLATPQVITSANAPNGFVYASIAVTATTVPTAMSVATPAAVNYQLFPGAPLGFAVTHGSAVGATAPATITGQAAKAVAPVVVLS